MTPHKKNHPSKRGQGEPVAAPLGPELSEHRWHAKAAELSETGMLTMARRLPALIGQVMRLAWQAGRADLAATVGFNAAVGVFTAFGLLATTRVLTALRAVAARAGGCGVGGHGAWVLGWSPAGPAGGVLWRHGAGVVGGQVRVVESPVYEAA